MFEKRAKAGAPPAGGKDDKEKPEEKPEDSTEKVATPDTAARRVQEVPERSLRNMLYVPSL